MVYAIIFLIIAAGALNEISKKYSFYNLVYNRFLSKTVVEINESFDITTIVENKKPLPVTFLQITEKLPLSFEYKLTANISKGNDYAYHTGTMSIMPYQRIKRTYKVSCSKRGRYTLYDSTLKAGDILGFNVFTKDSSMPQDIVVLPERMDLNSTLVSYGDYNGVISVKRWIIDDPVLTIGIREYTGFEPQKNIHWPSTLKSGRLMVKQFDYTTDSKAVVILNIECYKPFWSNIESEKIESCISISRSLVEEFEKEGISYGLITNGHLKSGDAGKINLLTGWGASHLAGILGDLGGISYAMSMTLEEILVGIINRDCKNTTFVIVSPRILEPYVEHINKLNKRCQKLIVITTDDENLADIDGNILSFVERGDKN